MSGATDLRKRYRLKLSEEQQPSPLDAGFYHSPSPSYPAGGSPQLGATPPPMAPLYATQSTDFPSPSFPSSGSSTPLFSVPRHLPPSSLKDFGERALRRKKYSEDVQDDLRFYMEVDHPEHRQLLTHLAILEMRDASRESRVQQEKAWEPSAQLTKWIAKMTKVAVVLPELAYYSGPVENAILETMREVNISGLPPAGSPNASTLKSIVANQVTIRKSALKAMVKESIKCNDEEARNIGAVCALAAQRASNQNDVTITPTLNMYYRFSFIRAHFGREVSNERFWPTLDTELENLREGGNLEYIELLRLAYQDDVEAHGDPTSHKFKVSASIGSSTSASWLARLCHHAALVSKIDTGSRGIKRRAPDADDDDDDADLAARQAPTGPSLFSGGTMGTADDMGGADDSGLMLGLNGFESGSMGGGAASGQ